MQNQTTKEKLLIIQINKGSGLLKFPPSFISKEHTFWREKSSNA
uniref:Uncharacterized protein n=1 Tax=Anguilla anguilla TaxID=7936 RepID=A0A0E9QIS3_ANGAN